MTRLLKEWGQGRPGAFDELLDRTYPQLRRIARNHFRRERANHTLQPTALVNELYLKLMGQEKTDWRNRSHFFALASRLMRRLLIDHARSAKRDKRRRIQVTLTEASASVAGPDVDVIALDDALQRLEEDFPRESQVVELRYFGGLTHEEVAQQLGVSVITAKRDWRFAKTWLLRELERGRGPEA